jgi:HK97 family phage portal protein
MVMDFLAGRIRRRGDNVAVQGYSRWPYPFSTAAVSDETALSLTAVYRCVVLIATTIAGLPLHVYQESADDSARRIKPPTARFLWDRPNPEMTRQTFWEVVIGHEVMGDAFLLVVKNASDDPLSLYYVEPWRVSVGRTSAGRKVYQIDGRTDVGYIDFTDGGEIIHVPNWSRDSLRGLSPIRVAAKAVALGLSSEDAAKRAMEEDARPSGVLATAGTMTQEKADYIAEMWRQRVSGGNKTPLLSGGVNYQQIAINPEDLELLEERKFQKAEIATLFGVPPHMIGETDRSTSWGTGIEVQTTGFLQFTLQAHIGRFEQAINDALLKRGDSNRYVKFELGGLLRPTLKERYEAHAIAYGKWEAANDIRAFEDMPPIAGGDVLLAPLNLGPAELVAGGASALPAAPTPEALQAAFSFLPWLEQKSLAERNGHGN